MKATVFAAAAMLISTSATAAPIIQFAQTSNANTITATANPSDTSTTILGTNVAVSITQNLGAFTGPAILNLTATSTDAATPAGTGALQHYAGAFEITSAPNATGTNYLSGAFTDAALGVGSALTLAIGAPPDTLNLTSSLIPATELTNPDAAAFSLTNVTPQIAITGTTIASFAATIAGNVSSSAAPPIPEPGSAALLTMGLLGLLALRRKQRTP